MSGHDVDIQKQVRGYKIIFGALAVGTVLTVAVSTLHLPLAAAIAVALLIATVKASLVAGWFMHLKSERKSIYAVLLVTAAFFLLLLMWPLLDIGDGMGKKNVMEGVGPEWTPNGGHSTEAGQAEHGAAEPGTAEPGSH